ncbi:hypothetical protein [Haloplanus salilacus]|uniref:hypothetical protein n=1 Tax=Haloplanus salilacus TaxID=2949994 RepID=UPI0030CF69A6
MNSNHPTSTEIEVLPSQGELARAIEAIAGDSSTSVPEERLRRELVANHPAVGQLTDEPEQAIQISETVEQGLLYRDDKGLLRLNDSTHVSSISVTRIR